MIRRSCRSARTRNRGPLAALGAVVLLGVFGMVTLTAGAAGHHSRARGADDDSGSAAGLGPLGGILPRDHQTLESAIQVNLSNETVRLPLYKGLAPDPKDSSKTETVWFVLLDASDSGLAHDLGLNFAPSSPTLASAAPPACRR
jgi:hypothetical protein